MVLYVKISFFHASYVAFPVTFLILGSFFFLTLSDTQQVFQIAMYSRAVCRSMLRKLDFLLLFMRLSKKALPMSLPSGQL